MKYIAFLFLSVTMVSCLFNTEKSKPEVTVYKYVGEYENNNRIRIRDPFVKIEQVDFNNTEDSIIVKIGLKNIPDSVVFNNPDVPNGYYEYYWDLELDIEKDGIQENNITASLYFNNYYYADSGLMHTSFDRFLEHCYLELMILLPPQEPVYSDELYFEYKDDTLIYYFRKDRIPSGHKITTDIPWCVYAVRSYGFTKESRLLEDFEMDVFSPCPEYFPLYFDEDKPIENNNNQPSLYDYFRKTLPF